MLKFIMSASERVGGLYLGGNAPNLILSTISRIALYWQSIEYLLLFV